MVESARGKEFVNLLIQEYEDLIRVATINASLAQQFMGKYQYDDDDLAVMRRQIESDQQDIKYFKGVLAGLKGEPNGTIDIQPSTVSPGMRRQAQERSASNPRIDCTTVL